ncbi:hypothetical protein [Pararhizobium sp. IMCC21322]|uniref:hypothetical protein n=1 Tax=Pararhizobium sp. IMCC21322 TaxID=3067903 RepID=UPI002741D3B9|nr:hypothetical protein [Pararhizobium sp. IMCC21322]
MTPQMCGTYPMIHTFFRKDGMLDFSAIDARLAIQYAAHRDVHHARHRLLRGTRITAHLPDIERSASRLPSLCGNARSDAWEACVADESGPLTH